MNNLTDCYNKMFARIAQLVEHSLGKGKVMDPSSIPGSDEKRMGVYITICSVW